MKKTKIISFFLSLSMLSSLVFPGTLALPIDAIDNPEDSGMEISKTAKANDDGTYTITLEAYATGSKIITEGKKDIPTDIVLVLDQSGSMGTTDFPSAGKTTYTEYTGNQTLNSNLYNKRHNNNGNDGNLYYKLDDGSYATVSVERTQGEATYTYTECPSDWQNDKSASWNDQSPDDYWKYSNNLYVKVGEKYQKVTLTREWVSTGFFLGYYKYTYTFPDGSTFVSEGNDDRPGDFDGRGSLYYLSETPGEYTYTYTCTDAEGNTIDIGTSTGANTNFTDATLYYRTVTGGGNITRLQALSDAVTAFIDSVSQKAAGKDGNIGTEDDVEHRVAVVGFASTGNAYSNTELLSTEGVVNYSKATSGNYADALVPVNKDGGLNSRLSAAINRLDAGGDTYLEYGMDMANKIFAQYPITPDDNSGRQRVVVVFTDGYPAPYGTDDFNYGMADNAIRNANTTKQTYKATVYTVGVFNTADPTADIETNFATSDGWWSDGWGSSGNNLTAQQEAVAANRYMHYVSSNFPVATSLNQGGSMNPNANPFAGGDSYYLSASDADTLNNIFEQIADNIESGGASTALDEKAVIRDIIAPQFTLPEGATADDITLETYQCTGKEDGEYTWTKNETTMGAKAYVTGDQVSVKGFDFAGNYVAEIKKGEEVQGYQGHKLVISFIVERKDGFLGGNNVYTNTSAGVYKDDSATEPVLTFERPQVNVSIYDVTVTAQDKNVYLLGDLTADQIKDGVTVYCGGVAIDLSKANENYGLESWQNAYVNITVEVKDADGNVITNLTDLTDDTTYTIAVTVAPKEEAKALSSGTPNSMDGKPGSDEADIFVFKPTLTYKDNTVYYGADVPTKAELASNLTDTKWMHGATEADTTAMGPAPTLTFQYKLESGVENEKIATKQDIPVSVDVRIDGMLGDLSLNNFITFVHQACDPACDWNETELDGNPAFLLHVKTCQLTVSKTGGAEDEPYVFTVKKNGVKYSEVTVVGNGSETIYELPVGTYTIQEDTGWSWRFIPSYSENVVLSKENISGTITCTNAKAKPYWLNGYSAIVKNIFGIKH